MRRLKIPLLWVVMASPLFGAQWEERGDAAWSRRAEAFVETGKVAPGPARTAVESYERALKQDPDNSRLLFKLVEAVYFEGHFVLEDGRARKRAFSRMVEIAERAVGRVRSEAGDPRTFDRLSPQEQAELLQAVPGAAEAHFWAAIAWGLWGMSHGHLASAGKGVAGKIRDHATMVGRIDERFADGGGNRLLGRLHTATPKVPLFTGWIDRRYGLELLERAHRSSTEDPRNALFLAEAILKYAPARRGEALELLRGLGERRPDPGYLVEQTEILSEARAVLAEAEAQQASAGGSER